MSLHGTREAELDDLLRAGALRRSLQGRARSRSARRSRACRSRTSRSSTWRRAKARCRPPVRASFTTNVGARRRTLRSSGRSRAITKTIVVRPICLRDWLLTKRPTALPWFSGEAQQEDAKVQARSERIRLVEEGLARHRAALLGGLPGDPATWGPDGASARARVRSPRFPSARGEARVVGDVHAAGHDGTRN